MRAYAIAIYVLCFNLGFTLFTVTMNLAGPPGSELASKLPESMRFIDQPGAVDPEGRTWSESIAYYAVYNYSQEVESEAEAQTSAWGDVLKGLQFIIGVVKFGVSGIYILVKEVLMAGGIGLNTSRIIAGLFQTGVYAIYLAGWSQYTRGSGMRGYE